jgi:starch-binding outer membrane protein, SusD/RagB family
MFKMTACLLYLLAGLGVAACTDLATTVEDGIGEEVVPGIPPPISDPAAALIGVYNQLRQLRGVGNTFALMEHSTDEMMGPTRGTDWSDFGVWRQLHAHTWDPSHGQVLGTWNDLNAGIFRATQVVEASAPASTPRQIAEARFLRAFFAFYVMDLFGQVPFRPSNAPPAAIPDVMDRSEAFAFIVQDLLAARPALPILTSGDSAGTASQEAVDFLLAKLYLNRAVYTTSTPALPSAGPYTFLPADMDTVIARVQSIINNPYTDLTAYWDNFHWNNTTLSKELVFVKGETAGADGNFTTFWWTLHYNNSPSNCCNGFVTLSDFYDLFETADVRRHAYIPAMTAPTGVWAGILEGQQYPGYTDPNTPVLPPLKDRGGNLLIFTRAVDLFYSNERMGLRVIKYPFNPGAQRDRPGTDFIFFRYADALLMQAEAYFRKGQTAQALTIVNQIRATDPNNRGASPLASISAQALLDERGRELYWEGWRRQDLIRFGVFTTAWEWKPVSGAYRVMFPIPQRALDTNPNLVQIKGY